MAIDDQTTIVLDTSILLNFVKVERLDLLGHLGARILLLDQVLAEVMQPAQRTAVEEAIVSGILALQSVTDIEELTLFAELRADGRLGAGECAVLAVAINRNFIAGLQDRKARAEAERRRLSLRLLRTEDLVLMLVRSGYLTLEMADQLLVEWTAKHRFRSELTSFRDVL